MCEEWGGVPYSQPIIQNAYLLVCTELGDTTNKGLPGKGGWRNQGDKILGFPSPLSNWGHSFTGSVLFSTILFLFYL